MAFDNLIIQNDPKNLKAILYQYAADGWFLFPVGKDKKPLTKHGFKDATQTQQGIDEYMRKYPDGNWAGYFQGQLIIDIDPRHGGSLDALEAKYGKLPKTRTHKTGGGGYHIICKQRAGYNIGNTVAMDGLSGVDRRGNGGYIVIPPSIHQSGNPYEVLDDSPIAEAPEWLLKIDNSNRKAEQVTEDIPQGKRNATLASLAGSLRSRSLQMGTIEAVLLEINKLKCKPPLSNDEVREIAQSISRYEPSPVRATDSIIPGQDDYENTNRLLISNSDNQYCIMNSAFHRIVHPKEGDDIEIPLCNFVAKIVEDILKDSGADTTRFFKIEGRLNGTVLPPVTIPEPNFDGMKWPRGLWGSKTQIIAGRSSADHMINAIRFSSANIKEKTIYTHTGWREINGKMAYLTQGGAIGEPNIEVELPPALNQFRLPQPEGNPKQAIIKSLEILNVADKKITLPTLILPYASVMNCFKDMSFTPWYLGPTGSLKTTMVALTSSHFGDFTDRNMKINWFGTRTELEKLAFAAKDIFFPVDDYAPPADVNEARELAKTVEYMIRVFGNRGQGKVRSRADLSSQFIYYPRGMLITSGEQLPNPGASRSARILPIPLSNEDFVHDSDYNFPLLTQAQKDRRFYPIAMAHFIKWIEENWQNVAIVFKDKFETYRTKAQKQDVHLRMIETVSLMLTSLDILTSFALEKGALTSSVKEALINDGSTILSALVSSQNSRIRSERPGIRYIQTLQDLFGSGRYCLRQRIGNVYTPTESHPGMTILGWADPPVAYVLTKAGYQAVYDACQRQGEYFGTHKEQTWEDLKALDYLVPEENKMKRPELGGPEYIPSVGTQRVLKIKYEVLFPPNENK